MSIIRETTTTAADQAAPATDAVGHGPLTGRNAGYLAAVAMLATVGAACGSSGEASEPSDGGRASVDTASTTTVVDLGEPSTTVIVTTVPETTSQPTVAPTDAPTTLAPTTDAPTTTIVETRIAEYQEVATFGIATLEDRVKAYRYLAAGATAIANPDGSYTFDLTSPRFIESPDDLPAGLGDAISGSDPSVTGIVYAYLKAGADAQFLEKLVLIDQDESFEVFARSADEMLAIDANATDGSADVLRSYATYALVDNAPGLAAAAACATSFSFSDDGAPTVKRGMLVVQVIDDKFVAQTQFVPFEGGVPEFATDLGIDC